MTSRSDSRWMPRRCRWFGHYWISTITGNPVDWLVGCSYGTVVCKRCGELHV